MSPALCALLLKPYINEDGTQKNNFAARFRKAFNTAFDAMIEKYKNSGTVLYQTQMAGMVVAGTFGSVAGIPDEYDKDQFGAR